MSFGGLVANKACAERVRQRERELMKQRMKNMKPTIDTRPPESMQLDHVRNNLKREQMLEERYHAIDRDNRILLQKMSDIMKNRSFKSEPRPSGGVSLVRDARKQELTRITQENGLLLRRLQQAQPVYNHVEWEESYRRSCMYHKGEFTPAVTRQKPPRSSSLTPLGRASKGFGATGGSSVTNLGLAPGEVNQLEIGEDLRYVLKEGRTLDGDFYFVEMATDGRSLAVTAYRGDNQLALELLVNEKNHRRLYREFNGDYAKIAERLRVVGDQLTIEGLSLESSGDDVLRSTA